MGDTNQEVHLLLKKPGFDYTTIIARADLLNHDSTPYINRTQHGVTLSNLMGAPHVQCERLRDENHVMRLFFVFTDVCCRFSGVYRLRFSLFDMEKSVFFLI